MVLRIPDSPCGIVQPLRWEARGWAQPFLEQSAAGLISQRGVLWCPLTCTGELGHFPPHFETWGTTQGTHGLMSEAPWFTSHPATSHVTFNYDASIFGSSVNLFSWPMEEGHTYLWASKMNAIAQEGFSVNLSYILAISGDYSQCNNKLPCCSLIGSKISF